MQHSMNADLVEQQPANDDKTLAQPKTGFNPSKIDVPRESDRDGNTLCNVHYSGCDTPTTPTFVDCRLENVHFINCKFRDTKFRNVKLANVAFINIDLLNATISDVELKYLAWKDTVVRNAVLVRSSTPKDVEHQVTCLRPYRPISNDNLTHTVIETVRFEQLSPKQGTTLTWLEKSSRPALRVEEYPRPRLLDRTLLFS